MRATALAALALDKPSMRGFDDPGAVSRDSKRPGTGTGYCFMFSRSQPPYKEQAPLLSLLKISGKHLSAWMIAMVQLREPPLRSDRQIVMARLAREFGRGRDAIYHGTRHLPLVLRSGKLLPAGNWDPAVFFTRSPEVAAYWANMLGREMDQYCGGILILNRTSLVQNYRLEPSRYAEEWDDEREESVWDRSINIRRHLLGVVRQAGRAAQ